MATKVKTLDIRVIPPRDKHPTFFKLFDELTAGQGFELINDHDPRPLYYQLGVERPGMFDWEMVEDGPEVWRVKIERK